MGDEASVKRVYARGVTREEIADLSGVDVEEVPEIAEPEVASAPKRRKGSKHAAREAQALVDAQRSLMKPEYYDAAYARRLKGPVPESVLWALSDVARSGRGRVL